MTKPSDIHKPLDNQSDIRLLCSPLWRLEQANNNHYRSFGQGIVPFREPLHYALDELIWEQLARQIEWQIRIELAGQII